MKPVPPERLLPSPGHLTASTLGRSHPGPAGSRRGAGHRGTGRRPRQWRLRCARSPPSCSVCGAANVVRGLELRAWFGAGLSLHQSQSLQSVLDVTRWLSPLQDRRRFEVEYVARETSRGSEAVAEWSRSRQWWRAVLLLALPTLVAADHRAQPAVGAGRHGSDGAGRAQRLRRTGARANPLLAAGAAAQPCVDDRLRRVWPSRCEAFAITAAADIVLDDHPVAGRARP